MARRGSAGAPLILGVDGGNSKVALALATADGQLLARIKGPTISHQAVDLRLGMRRLGELVGSLRAEAGQAARGGAAADGRAAAGRDAVAYGADAVADLGIFCVAGADLPADVRLLQGALEETGVARRILVRNDGFAGLRAGATSGWGVAVVCGAGVNCVGISPDGRRAALPALGDISGDWGGGTSIGQAGLAAAVRARDGRGPRTVLERLVPEHFGARRPFDVTIGLYTGRIPARRIRELSAIVFQAAMSGDVVARGIIDRQADELAVMALAMIRRLRLARLPVEVVLSGGVFRTRDPAFYSRITDGVQRGAPSAITRRLNAAPVLGSLLLGLDELSRPDKVRAERRLRAAFGQRHERAGGAASSANYRAGRS
jgi:N-acetylglucosamine kinase-like BadF-type ATPase